MAEITSANSSSVTLAVNGAASDLSSYFDLYNANGTKLDTKKTYNAETNEITLTSNSAMEKGEAYSVRVANVQMIAETGIYYSGNTEMKFISPAFDGYLVSKVFSNRGNGAYAGATVKNNGSEAKSVMLVIAEKNADGVIVKVNVASEKLAPGAESENLYANFLSIDSANTIEAYIWEAEALRPLTNKITVVHQD